MRSTEYMQPGDLADAEEAARESEQKAAKRLEEQPACDACGSTDYELPLKDCPFCGGTKCDICDMGDDLPCMACEDEN